LSAAEQGNLGHISDAEAATVVYAPGLDPELEARVLSHVASCADCGRRLEALRIADRSIGELLSSLDVPAPGTSAAALMRTARTPRRQIFVTSRRHAAAAVIAFMVVAAAAAAAIPASPLHRFVVRALSGEKGAAAAIRSRGSAVT